MATKKRNFISKEVEDFTTELYNYIWTKHRFMSPSLEKEFSDKLSLIFDEPKKTSNFDDCIGKAVYCSQYLLRDFCRCKFKSYGCDLIESDIMFCICVFDAIQSWTYFRSNVFIEIIDCAAIAAEAVLFCDAEFEGPIELDRATFIFKTFLTIFLKTDFYKKGSWSGLQATAQQDYHSLYLVLRPYLQLQHSPYEKMTHHCRVLKELIQSPVQFPFDASSICKDCETYFDVLFYESNDRKTSFYVTLKNIFKNNFISKNEQLLQKIDVIIEDIKVAKNAQEDNSEQLQACREEESESYITVGEISNSFLYFMLEKEDQEAELMEAKKKHSRKRRLVIKPKKNKQAKYDRI